MDVEKIRQDFPFINRTINGRTVIYFDNAATSQKPVQVLNTITKFYSKYNAAINRSSHFISDLATRMYIQAHEKISNFIKAGIYKEIILTRNSTEAINLVCYSLIQTKDKLIGLYPGDEIIIPLAEHHSNLVPWQRLKETGIVIKFIEIQDNGVVDPRDIRKHITGKTKLICCSHVSNILGCVNPVKEIASLTRDAGALLLVDGTQSAPHIPINVKDLGCDFFTFSGHKMLGPTGIGVLYARMDLLKEMAPFLTGGGMIKNVTQDAATWNELPWKFEAGTPDVCGAIALAGSVDPENGDELEGAIDYLSNIGMDNIHRHELDLFNYAVNKMSLIDEIILYTGESRLDKCGIISFNVVKDNEIIDPNIIANFLNEDGIAVRSGGLCAFPMAKKLNDTGVVRASFYLYNTFQEIDFFIESLNNIIAQKII